MAQRKIINALNVKKDMKLEEISKTIIIVMKYVILNIIMILIGSINAQKMMVAHQNLVN